jgi:hypothetical protein
MDDVIVGDRVADLLAVAPPDDEVRRAQHPKMLRHQRLVHGECGHQLVDAPLTVLLELEDHPETDRVAQHLEQLGTPDEWWLVGRRHLQSIHLFALVHNIVLPGDESRGAHLARAAAPDRLAVAAAGVTTIRDFRVDHRERPLGAGLDALGR